MNDESATKTKNKKEEINASFPLEGTKPLMVNISRSWLDWLLASIQLASLIGLIGYVALTSRYVELTSQMATSTRDAAVSSVKATEADIQANLIQKLYSDEIVQKTLDDIIEKRIKFTAGNGEPLIVGGIDAGKRDVFLDLNITLNQFQILGQMHKLGVLRKEHLIGLRYEIIEIGRNQAVRDYFDYLNHDYQKRSGIVHDHFRNLKELYLIFEYDDSQKEQFRKYLFEYPPNTF